MGNVRPTFIKRVAIDLVEKYPQYFNSDFQHNKQQLEKVTTICDKSMKNSVAGYVTTYWKRANSGE
jgi:small subunit ribosomal protein S17e